MSLQRRKRQKARIIETVKADDKAPDGVMLNKAELRVFQMLAAQIIDNSHLYRILLSVPEERRELIYEQIKTAITFKPLPFNELAAAEFMRSFNT